MNTNDFAQRVINLIEHRSDLAIDHLQFRAGLLEAADIIRTEASKELANGVAVTGAEREKVLNDLRAMPDDERIGLIQGEPCDKPASCSGDPTGFGSMHDAIRGGYTKLEIPDVPPKEAAQPCATKEDAKDENLVLRKMLANAYAGASLYQDDGEAQDSRAVPFIDFMRDSTEEIMRKMISRTVVELAEACAKPEFNDDACRAAYENRYHKIRAEYPYDEWAACWQAARSLAVNPWREVVLDECAISHMPFWEADPRKTIKDVIGWHCAVALDPLVSESAQALIDQGRSLAGTEDAKRLGFVEALAIAEGVFYQYKMEHPKWWNRMDGTPILNDIAVRMAVALQVAMSAAPGAQKEGQS